MLRPAELADKPLSLVAEQPAEKGFGAALVYIGSAAWVDWQRREHVQQPRIAFRDNLQVRPGRDERRSIEERVRVLISRFAGRGGAAGHAALGDAVPLSTRRSDARGRPQLLFLDVCSGAVAACKEQCARLSDAPEGLEQLGTARMRRVAMRSDQEKIVGGEAVSPQCPAFRDELFLQGGSMRDHQVDATAFGAFERGAGAERVVLHRHGRTARERCLQCRQQPGLDRPDRARDAQRATVMRHGTVP